jgi:hypothetical protein
MGGLRAQNRPVCRRFDGARGTRTPDLLGAIQAIVSLEFCSFTGSFGHEQRVHGS